MADLAFTECFTCRGHSVALVRPRGDCLYEHIIVISESPFQVLEFLTHPGSPADRWISRIRAGLTYRIVGKRGPHNDLLEISKFEVV